MSNKRQSFSERMRAVFSDVTNELERVRSQIADLKARRDQVANARLPKAEVLARLNEFVDSEAAGFDAAWHFVNPASSPDARMIDITGFEIGVSGEGHHRAADAGGLLCWLMGDVVKKRLAELVNAADFSDAVPADKRAGMLRDLDEQIHALEIQEEALITDADAAGIELARRADCDPAIVLEVVEATRYEA
ncbi:MAG: hypothetical protein AB7U81_14260 [Thiohalomonadaceae bacterium]